MISDCPNGNYTQKYNGVRLCKDPTPLTGDKNYANWVHSKGMIYANSRDGQLANKCAPGLASFLDIVIFPNCGKY